MVEITIASIALAVAGAQLVLQVIQYCSHREGTNPDQRTRAARQNGGGEAE